MPQNPLRQLLIASIQALIPALLLTSEPGMSHAASVYGITQDDLQMNTLGENYIHPRHTGLMPYWGPCYRCKTQVVSEPACTPGTQATTLATWTSSGNSSCGGYESDTFTAQTQCSTSGVVQLVLQNDSYNPADSTGQMYYDATIDVPVPDGGNYGQYLNMNAVFGGGNNCSQNFDWYPTYGVTGEDINGTFNGTVTFGNYLSPGQYQQSPSFPIVFQNYKLVAERVCKQYAPTSTECQTPPTQSQTDLPTYSWACDTAENGWNSGVCTNSAISSSGAQWIFGATDGMSGTAQSGYSVMQAQYVNPTNTPMPATLTFGADNYGWVWINGVQVAFWNHFTTLDSVSIDLPAGTDTVDFMVMNDPNSPSSNPNEYENPSAGILSITNSAGQTILSTNDTDWVMVENYPSTPNPTPQSLLAGTGYTPQNCAAGGC